MILDGIENVFLPNPQSDIDTYETLFRLFFQYEHSSCLLVTSRLRPSFLSPVDEQKGLFQLIEVAGLAGLEEAMLLDLLRIDRSNPMRQRLRQQYLGNPLLLERISTVIHELFGGELKAFLNEEIFFFGAVGEALREQLQPLSPLEIQILDALSRTG